MSLYDEWGLGRSPFVLRLGWNELPPAIVSDTCEIFFDLNGFHPTEIVATKLARGLANEGIYVHALSSDDVENTSSVVTRILEKRTQKARELKATQAIRDWGNRDDDALRVFPAIFALREHADYCSIFMEYLEGAGNRPKEVSGPIIDAIVTSVILLNRGLTAPNAQKQSKKIIESWGKKSEAARTSLGFSNAQQSVVRKAGSLLEGQPVYMGHNDLFWPNMALNELAGTVRFLDFGLVGNNIAGAEFHHFFRRNLLSTKVDGSFDLLIEKYAKESGLSVSLLTMASQCYALVRAYERIGRIDEKQGRDAFQREMSFIERVESRIHKKLETGIET